MNDQKNKNLCLFFYFCKILKMREKNIMKSAKKFCSCFILYKEKMLMKIKPQLKVEIEDGRETP